jgi:hypothetical protein
MALSPAATWLVYMVCIGLLITGVAVVADIWTAKVERDARRQARADARAKRREERDCSQVEWHSQ